ncbi:hypothetical protein BST36_20740 [Mycolicibacterium moriokaense]|nr:hypothetical protein BST36_20740 [Mycolicibacterium moriokaense]
MSERHETINTMTTCEPCALREAGDTAQAETYESIRQQRLLLSFLNDAGDSVAMIASELRGCHDCMGRIAASYLTMTAESLCAMFGRENAIAAVQKGLLEDLDG